MYTLRTLFGIGLFFLCFTVNGQYPHNGFSPVIIQKQGMGGTVNYLQLTPQSTSTILTNYYDAEPSFLGKYSPIKVSVYDTSAVITGNYQLVFDDIDSSSLWKIYRVGTTDTVWSNQVIGSGSDFFIPQWGIVVTIEQINYNNQGNFIDTLGSSIAYSNPNLNWLDWVMDDDNNVALNWNGSGIGTGAYLGSDPYGFYKSFNGAWSPYFLCRNTANYSDTNYVYPISYALANTRPMQSWTFMNSIDLYFTSDTSKWTRCPVIETCPNINNSQGNVMQQKIRSSLSVNKLGLPDGTGTGMGWFPGFAINVETGERINMAFGENSCLPGENGADMLFNPTSSMFDINGNQLLGGNHIIYLFNNEDKHIPGAGRMTRYDEGALLDNYLHSNSSANHIKAWRSCQWVGYPVLKSGHQVLESDCKIELRVKKRYEKYLANTPNFNWLIPLYEFELSPSIVLSTSEIEQTSSSISIYPNPISSQGVLLINDLQAQIKQVEIYDISGKVVYSDNFLRSNSFVIENNGKYAPGVYFYNVIDKNNTVYKGKIMFQ